MLFPVVTKYYQPAHVIMANFSVVIEPVSSIFKSFPVVKVIFSLHPFVQLWDLASNQQALLSSSRVTLVLCGTLVSISKRYKIERPVWQFSIDTSQTPLI